MTQTPSRGCVVLGAGLAGAKVVETLRQEGFSDPVTLVGDEPQRPYDRPPLSKDYLLGKTAVAALFVHDQGWYAEHQVETRFGVAARAIDRVGHRVLLQSGEQLGYRHLVIATGSAARNLDLPGAQLGGVHTLRSVQDGDALARALSTGGRCVIVGAGWIGLEVAAAARQLGCEVTVLEHAPAPLQHVLGERLADHFAQLHRSHGVDLRTDVSVRAIEGSGGKVTGVYADDQLIGADTVVVAVGASPRTALAAEAGLSVDGGIVVDGRLRTSDPHVLAAGDVANAYNHALGTSLRVEHWDNAIRQGALAAASVLDRPERYDWQPYFYTDQFDLSMEYVGRGAARDEVIVRGDVTSGEFIAFWVREGRVRAGMNVNIWDVNADLRSLIGHPVSRERLEDPGVPLDALIVSETRTSSRAPG